MELKGKYLNKNSNMHFFVELDKFEKGKDKKKKKGKLAGKLIAIKANINVLGLHASCGSKVLENYLSTYDASVIEKIKEEDGLIIGMVNCDEFASGSSGETSAFGACHNPVQPDLIPGGSSSGSAAAVAAGFVDNRPASAAVGETRLAVADCRPADHPSRNRTAVCRNTGAHDHHRSGHRRDLSAGRFAAGLHVRHADRSNNCLSCSLSFRPVEP